MTPARAGRAGSWAAGNNWTGLAKPPQKGRFGAAFSGLRVTGAGALACLQLAACGGSPAPVPEALPFEDPGFAEAGEYRLHYALTMTSDLPSGIAGSYGIVQRHNLALLALTLVPRDPMTRPHFDAPVIKAESVSLTGERSELTLVRHDEAGGPSFLATVEVRHRVPVTVDIRARATTASPEIRVRLTREFRLE
jgi:uncharacterized protein DUF4426